MMVHLWFIFCSALQDGNTGPISAQLTVYSVIEGEDVRVECSFTSYKKSKFFCKETCKQEDILIETTDAKAYQRGRYRIDHKEKDFFVTITQLTKSDSGKYGCGSAASSSRNSSTFIEIIVVDAKLDGGPSAEKAIDARTGGNIVVECSFAHYEPGSTSARENLTQSDSGWYRCGLGRPDSKDPYQRFRLIVTDALTTSTPSSSVPSASSLTTNQSESSTSLPASSKTTKHPEETKGVILLRLTLVVLVIVSSLSVVFCRKRTCKAKREEPEPHVETQCASAPEAEDDPSQPNYSEIKFVSVGSSHGGFHGGFHGDAECVIYSVPLVEASSDEPPLYSTVNNPQ
ncbi:CMRF35-like molecule 5 [Dissostichus eleginoides]|uniref:CMRF35-like molecule 5 n=1 Tax=Dissostichus eleginoides TaxID=100907 RepID=A0AAD9CAR4_DISEL|nr:CMRF35-like molecule 5 [Dissostichus eleginoides]